MGLSIPRDTSFLSLLLATLTSYDPIYSSIICDPHAFKPTLHPFPSFPQAYSPSPLASARSSLTKYHTRPVIPLPIYIPSILRSTRLLFTEFLTPCPSLRSPISSLSYPLPTRNASLILGVCSVASQASSPIDCSLLLRVTTHSSFASSPFNLPLRGLLRSNAPCLQSYMSIHSSTPSTP